MRTTYGGLLSRAVRADVSSVRTTNAHRALVYDFDFGRLLADFSGTLGVTYHVAVDGRARGPEGSYQITWTKLEKMKEKDGNKKKPRIQAHTTKLGCRS